MIRNLVVNLLVRNLCAQSPLPAAFLSSCRQPRGFSGYPVPREMLQRVSIFVLHQAPGDSELMMERKMENPRKKPFITLQLI